MDIKLCKCGCGQPTNVVQCTHSKRGLFKGQHYHYVAGHGARKPRPEPPAYSDSTARYIPLTKGKFALVDTADYDHLANYTWFYASGYAARYGGKEMGGKTIFMHNEIALPPDGLEVDHVNLDKLDNRRSNLRHCTRTQNLGNVRSKKGSSKYKGVSKTKSGAWQVHIQKNKKNTSLGTYASEIEAAMAYDAAAREHFGEFARCNFPTIIIEPAAVQAPAPQLDADAE